MTRGRPIVQDELHRARDREMARSIEDTYGAAWEDKPHLRAQYEHLYGLLAEALPAGCHPERVWELGAGICIAARIGATRAFMRSDVLPHRGLHAAFSAEAMPLADGSLDGLIALDVLHHCPAPARLFAEAGRVLRPGGRLVLVEPWVSPLSWPVYRFLHHERLDLSVDPLDQGGLTAVTDPHDGNQAIPYRMFGPRSLARFREHFPRLAVRAVEPFCGLSLPLSGGVRRPPLLPFFLWKGVFALEQRLPAWLMRRTAFRVRIVMERVAG